MSDKALDNFTIAQSMAQLIDERVQMANGDTGLLIQHATLHALLAVADILEGIHDQMDQARNGVPPGAPDLFDPTSPTGWPKSWTPKLVDDEPYPGP